MTNETYCRACNIDSTLGSLMELRDMLELPKEITIVPDSDALSPVKLLNFPKEVRNEIILSLANVIDKQIEKLETEFAEL